MKRGKKRGYHWGRRSYKAGTTNTICDSSGFKVKYSQVLPRWDGLFVIKEDWEPRDPQDFPPPVKKQAVFKNARPPKIETATAPTIDEI